MEKDLFAPIKKYFEDFGYTADGEVKDIDLYMEKDGESVAVELKQTLDFKAVQQAALRQKITDRVFIGIFRPKDINSGAFKDKLYLLKRLGIGLIVVAKRTGSVTVVSEPEVTELTKYQSSNRKKRQALENEFQKRRVKNNIGGVHREKLITSYREDALLVLDTLAELGGESPSARVAKESGIKRAATIMRNNYYSWFDRIDKGVYRIRQEGYDALEEFEDTIYLLRRGDKSGRGDKSCEGN